MRNYEILHQRAWETNQIIRAEFRNQIVEMMFHHVFQYERRPYTEMTERSSIRYSEFRRTEL